MILEAGHSTRTCGSARTRLERDRIFAEGRDVMLGALDAGWWDRLRAKPIYPGVRLGGRGVWNRHRREKPSRPAWGYPELLDDEPLRSRATGVMT